MNISIKTRVLGSLRRISNAITSGGRPQLVTSIIIFLILLGADYAFSLTNKNFSFFWNGRQLVLFIIIFLTLNIESQIKRFIALSVFPLLTLVQHFHFQYFGSLIQPIEFHLFINNMEETRESFFAEIGKMKTPLYIFIASITAIFLTNKVYQRYNIRNNSLQASPLALFLLILMLLPAYLTYKDTSNYGKISNQTIKYIYPLPGMQSSINLLRSSSYYLSVILPKKFFSPEVPFAERPSPIPVRAPMKLNIVFLLGESLSAKHLSVFGYPKDTTPELKELVKTNNDIIAKTVLSAGTMTVTSVSAIINHIEYPGSSKRLLDQSQCLFKLAKKQGYKTYFYSTQSKIQVSTIQSYLCLNQVDHFKTGKDMGVSKSIKDWTKFEDMKLVESLEKIDLSKGDKFVVLQMRGSHSPYSSRFPKGWGNFDNAYDNSVNFTNKVIQRLIAYIEKHKKNTIFVFTADHGELTGEYGKWGHGWFYPEVYTVPFIFMSSDPLYANEAKKVISHYDISSLILDILGYNVSIKPRETVYINGSDIDALAGYLRLKVDKEGKIISKNKVLY